MSDNEVSASGPETLCHTDPPGDAGTVPPGRFCVQCRYQLGTLDARGNCPECGVPIRESCAAPLLVSSDSDFLLSLRRGSVRVIAGAWLYAIFWLLGLASIAFGVFVFPLVMYISRPFFIAGALVLTLGLRTLASPDPQAAIRTHGSSGQSELRHFATSCAVLAIVEAFVWFLGLMLLIVPGEPASFALLILICTVALRHFFTVGLLGRAFPYVAWLATRLPDVRLYERAQRSERSLALTGMLVLFAFPLGMLVPALLSASFASRIAKAARMILDQRASGEPPASD